MRPPEQHRGNVVTQNICTSKRCVELSGQLRAQGSLLKAVNGTGFGDLLPMGS